MEEYIKGKRKCLLVLKIIRQKLASIEQKQLYT